MSKNKNIDSYKSNGDRDFSLAFVGFWKEFVSGVGVEELRDDITPYSLDFLIYQLLFPKTVLEQAEERLQIINIAKSFGVDPNSSDFIDLFDNDVIAKYRKHFPAASDYTDDEKHQMISDMLIHEPNTGSDFKLAMNAGENFEVVGRVKTIELNESKLELTLTDTTCAGGLLVNIDPLRVNNKSEMTAAQAANMLEAGDYVQLTVVIELHENLAATGIAILSKNTFENAKQIENNSYLRKSEYWNEWMQMAKDLEAAMIQTDNEKKLREMLTVVQSGVERFYDLGNGSMSMIMAYESYESIAMDIQETIRRAAKKLNTKDNIKWKNWAEDNKKYLNINGWAQMSYKTACEYYLNKESADIKELLPKIINPVFLTDLPQEYMPLAKCNDSNETYSYCVVANSTVIAKCYNIDIKKCIDLKLITSNIPPLLIFETNEKLLNLL